MYQVLGTFSSKEPILESGTLPDMPCRFSMQEPRQAKEGSQEMIIEPPARPLPPPYQRVPEHVVDSQGSVCRVGDVAEYEYSDNRSQIDGVMERSQ